MMADLVVVGFKGIDRAGEVFSELEAMEERYDSTMNLVDAVAVYRDTAGNLKLALSTEPTKAKLAGWGAVLGLLMGAAIAIPFAAGAGAATAAVLATGALEGGAVGTAGGVAAENSAEKEFGLTEEFVRRVSAMLQPGDSALFALIRAAYPQQVAEQFRGFGGKVLQTSLTPEQSRKLQSVLDDHTPSKPDGEAGEEKGS
jgi:uncharacterized membrane protein